MPPFLPPFNNIVNPLHLPIKTLKPVIFFHSSPPLFTNPNQQLPLPSPSRIHKLIASQSDPLVAKEIFDLASNTHPRFRHSYASFHTLILKLARSRHFPLMNSLLSRLKSDRRYTVAPSLFTHIIRIYGDADLPEKALKTFYTILEFNMKPLTKQLNVILEILVSQRRYLRPAFDLFKSAHRYDVSPNVESYNILMRGFCSNDDLSIAHHLFDEMLKRDVVPNVESYRILMQGLCRKSQVNKAVEFLDDMLNKGFVPDSLIYTTLLNSLCRKKKLREAYKVLCRMKVKGCDPDIVHYNTVILGFCRENRAHDGCKVVEDMESNGCLPNLVSYRTIVGGLCSQGLYDEARTYLDIMLSKGFSLHASVWHVLINGLCNVGRVDEACSVLECMLKSGEVPHLCTWMDVASRICEVEFERLEEVLKVEIEPCTRIVEAGVDLQEYLIKKGRTNAKFKSRKEKV
ncbi:hypothetical protein SSX86_001084 [Deinandra increscens subsp. villosa]|uniref:Pentatricopeptide repeat-containing protein n=1 Tax=Deinandra increscens subsp. villosa TaxID=3103831 RepID=A0AAP0DUB8_9ASTR